MEPIQFSRPYHQPVFQTDEVSKESFSICNMLSNLCEDWKYTALVIGSVLSIVCCVAAIFETAYLFSLCYMGLAAVCIFAAKEIRDLGSLKGVSEELKTTNENLTTQVDEFTTQNNELRASIGNIQTENQEYQTNNARLLVQVQSLQSASEAIQERFQKLLEGIDQGAKNQQQAAKEALQSSLGAMKDEHQQAAALRDGILQRFSTKFQELNLIARDWKQIFHDTTVRQEAQFNAQIEISRKILIDIQQQIERAKEENRHYEVLNQQHQALGDRLEKQVKRIESSGGKKNPPFPLNDNNV